MWYKRASDLLRRAEAWGYGRMVQEGLDLINDAVKTIVTRKGETTKADLQRAVAVGEVLTTNDGGKEYLWCDRREQRRDPMVCALHCADTEGEWKPGSAERIRNKCWAWAEWNRQQGETST